MFLKAPDFWYSSPSFWLTLVLKPFSVAYGFIAHRLYKRPYKHNLGSNNQVIAIGGATVGGSGKTVVVRSLCQTLMNQGLCVAVLSRGYGRSKNDIRQVNIDTDKYQDVGDEPLMLSKTFPVFVGRDRFEAAKLATNAQYLILDDGITQRSLKPHKKIIVLNADQGFGNGELLPLGPNRLDLEKIKFDIDAICLIYEKNKGNKIALELPKDIPVYRGYCKYNFGNLSGRIMPFCGIGFPKKFFQIFSNFEVCKTMAFPDHYPYKDEDLQQLIHEAARLRAQLVTTEKDLMRVPEIYRDKIKTVIVDLVWETQISELFM